MSILASWYTEQENCEKPVVVIIDDVERCYGPVLADFIIMLREWVVKIPIVLILGVATTVDVLRDILCSKVCSHLSVCEFTLGTPAERMDAVVEAIFLKNCESFSVGKDVSTFLRNYFLRHDGTLTLFIRALRMAMVQHVYMEPSSIALRKFVHEEGAEGTDDDVLLEDSMLKQALDLPSLQRCLQPSTNCVDWTYGLSELKRLHRLWSSTVMVSPFKATKCVWRRGYRLFRMAPFHNHLQLWGIRAPVIVASAYAVTCLFRLMLSLFYFVYVF